jgi:hypothetical protein
MNNSGPAMFTRDTHAPRRSPERLAAERWFLRHGLPFVLRPGTLLRRVWPRSAPALAAFATTMCCSVLIVLITGKHTINIDGTPTRTEWFVLAVVVFVLPLSALVGWLVSRIEGWRGRDIASAVSIVIAVIATLVGGPSPLVFFDLFFDGIVIAAIFLCTATGIGSILGWAVRMTGANLASIGALLVRALPVLLLTVLVFFNGPAWLMAASVERGRLWLALGVLLAIATAFLTSNTMAMVRPILEPGARRPEDAQALTGTPFHAMPDQPRKIHLTRPERVNVVFVLVLSQLVNVATVAAVTGLIFLVFGLILVNPPLLEALTHGGRPDGTFLSMTLPIPDALIQIVMLLTTLTFMYLAARAAGDKEYRAQFFDPLLDDLRRTLVARDRYRASSAGV